MVGSVVTGLVRSHVWNSDVTEVAEEAISGGGWPRARGEIRLEDYSMSDGSVVPAGGTPFSNQVGFNHTAALSTGGSSFAFARLYTVGTAITLDQGDGSGANWQQLRTFSGSSFHRMCLAATTDGIHMVAAWAGLDEVLLTGVGDPNPAAGSRSVLFVESHDGGNSWNSTPSAISGLRVRAGVTCSYDTVQDKFVLVGADNSHAINAVHRSSALGSPWSAPASLTSAGDVPRFTAETPIVNFDPYISEPRGLVSWSDVDDNDSHLMWIRFRWCTQIAGGCAPGEQPGKYVADSALLSPWLQSYEPNLLRSSVIPNAIEATRHWAFTVQHFGNQATHRRGFTLANTFLDTVTSGSTLVGGGPAWEISRYHSAAANRFFVETAYLSYYNRDP
jgi:hypothetical protein